MDDVARCLEMVESRWEAEREAEGDREVEAEPMSVTKRFAGVMGTGRNLPLSLLHHRECRNQSSLK